MSVSLAARIRTKDWNKLSKCVENPLDCLSTSVLLSCCHTNAGSRRQPVYYQQSNSARSIYFKQCPRCNGDISASSDQYGDYIHCLQCGYMADIKDRHSAEAIRISAPRRRVA